MVRLFCRWRAYRIFTPWRIKPSCSVSTRASRRHLTERHDCDMDPLTASFKKERASTVHGGSAFLQQFGASSSGVARSASSACSPKSTVDSSAIQTLLPIDWGSPLHAPASADANPEHPWTVHDGNFFATAVNKHQPRELGERRLIGEAREERVTWHKQRRGGDTPDRLRRIFPPPAPSSALSGAQCVPVIAPVPVSNLG